jgi:hypothetical protein
MFLFSFLSHLRFFGIIILAFYNLTEIVDRLLAVKIALKNYSLIVCHCILSAIITEYNYKTFFYSSILELMDSCD